MTNNPHSTDAMICADCGWSGSTADWRAGCKGFPCELNASTVRDDELVALRTENERLNERLVETQMLAFKWMEAHDKLHAGKPYEFPKLADLPDALAMLERYETALELMVPIIEEERQVAVDGYTVLYRGSPDFGKVVDPDAVGQIAKYDAALNAARKALGDSH